MFKNDKGLISFMVFKHFKSCVLAVWRGGHTSYHSEQRS